MKVRGLEPDGRGEIAAGLTVAVAGTYTDALVMQGNPVVGTAAQLSGVTGTRPLGVPEWSASSFVPWDLEQAVAGPLGGVSIGGGVRHVGESDGTATRAQGAHTVTDRFASNGYILADAVIGYDVGAIDSCWDRLSLSVDAANLLDTRHIASRFFYNSCYFGASRTVVGTLRHNW